jgi:hypothetical protein
VSGLRIAKSSFSVTKETGSNYSGEISGSRPPAGASVPAEVGGSVALQGEKNITDSYETVPDIVFAYRTHVIRPKRAGIETEMFGSKSAFLTSDGKTEESPIDVETIKEKLDEKLEVEVEFTTTPLSLSEMTSSISICWNMSCTADSNRSVYKYIP